MDVASLDIPIDYCSEHVSSDYLRSCLDILLAYSTGEFQALQLIVRAVRYGKRMKTF